MSSGDGVNPPNFNAFILERKDLPGMLPQEVAVFKAWWASNNAKFTDAQFNVRVGTGFDPGSAFSESVRKSAIDSTRKRIDALLYQGEQPYIVEVKYRAVPVVIGQILAYNLLFMRDHPQSLAPKLLLLCVLADDDTRYVLDQMGIPFEIVPANLTGIRIAKG